MTAISIADVQLVVVDRRRGNVEGQEDDKLLGFYPQTIPLEAQVGTAGLLQGLLQFDASLSTSDDTISPDTHHIIENDSSIWAVHEAESNIFLALLAAKAWLPRHVPQANLVAALIHVHNIMHLLFGGVQATLNEDASGSRTRTCVATVLNYVGRELASTSSWLHRELRNPFTWLGGLPSLHLPVDLILEVHCLTHRAELAMHDHCPLVADVVVSHRGCVLWSSLPTIDTARMASLLACGMMAPQESSKWAEGLGGTSALAGKNLQILPGSGFVVLRDDFCTTDGIHTLPFVYDSAWKLRHLLTYHQGEVTMLLFTRDDCREVSAEALQALQSELELPVKNIVAALAKQVLLQGCELGHVPGWRYRRLLQGAAGVRASPRGKVSAMSHHARSVATAVLDSVDRLGDSAEEVVVRSCGGVWASVADHKITASKFIAVHERRLGTTASECIDGLTSGLAEFQLATG
jgi:hypothetical protein